MGNLWFIYALSAAVLWGGVYTIDERLLKAGISPVVLMIAHSLFMLPLYFLLNWKQAGGMSEIKLLFQNKDLIYLFVLGSVLAVAANIIILMGFAEKNAALVSLVEISYPIFIILFSYMFIKDFNISLYTLFGGLMIFAGVFVVYKTS